VNMKWRRDEFESWGPRAPVPYGVGATIELYSTLVLILIITILFA